MGTHPIFESDFDCLTGLKMRAFSLLIGLGLTNAVDLPQDIIGEASCDARGQDTTYPGMCECEEGCCTSQAQTEGGCPVDIVIAIDMCSCNNDTWHDMKEFTRSAVNALNEQFGISDTDNSGRMAIFQFMEDVHNVGGLETFTRKEIMKKVNNMENTKFHGRGTDMTKAVKHAQSILDSSTRRDLEGIRRVFAVITNGYSDAKLTTDQDVVEAVFTMTASDDVDTVFVAREDSSVSNQRGTHTNTEVADVFERSLRLRDPVAPQQLIGDIECDEAPEPDYNRHVTANVMYQWVAMVSLVILVSMVLMDQWVNRVFLVNKVHQVVRVTMVQWENKETVVVVVCQDVLVKRVNPVWTVMMVKMENPVQRVSKVQEVNQAHVVKRVKWAIKENPASKVYQASKVNLVIVANRAMKAMP